MILSGVFVRMCKQTINSDDSSNVLDLMHSHALLVEVGIRRGIQTETLDLLPHDQTTRLSQHPLLHSNLHDHEESRNHEEDRRSAAHHVLLGSRLLASRSVVSIVTEATRRLTVAVVSAHTTTSAQLVIHLSTLHRASVDGLQLQVVHTLRILNHNTVLGQTLIIVHAIEAQTQRTLLDAPRLIASSVRESYTRARVIVIYNEGRKQTKPIGAQRI